ncbi:SOS response-associated peptidase, partial [Escherichia coli]|nr:SOS response-associated peptidase [Escherichia coli]
RPLVFSPEAAREWMRQNIGGKEAEEIASDGTVPAEMFIWHAVTPAVGNVKAQGRRLILPL